MVLLFSIFFLTATISFWHMKSNILTHCVTLTHGMILHTLPKLSHIIIIIHFEHMDFCGGVLDKLKQIKGTYRN